MRIIIQRVSEASVTVDGKIVAQIERGFLILLGITQTDGEPEAVYLARKIVGLRLFEDAAGKMNLGLEDVGGRALIVSQFTLYADARKGRRPSFTDAAPNRRNHCMNGFVNWWKVKGYPCKRVFFRPICKWRWSTMGRLRSGWTQQN